MTGQKEVIADMLPAVLAQLLGVFGGVKKLLYRKGGPFDGIAKQAGIFVGYLQRYPADGRGDDGFALPQGLGNRQAESLFK